MTASLAPNATFIVRAANVRSFKSDSGVPRVAPAIAQPNRFFEPILVGQLRTMLVAFSTSSATKSSESWTPYL